MPGPNLQAGVYNVLINFRYYVVPLCADLVKIPTNIGRSLRKKQHVLRRKTPSEALQEYELNTVTCDIRPSAFLAMRVIKKLVIVEGPNFPLASDVTHSCIYVDNIVGGADSIQEQLIALFFKGGFTLNMWN